MDATPQRDRGSNVADDHAVRQLAELSARRELVRQFVLVAGAVLLYFGTRGMTQGNTDVAVRHGIDILVLEHRLGIDAEEWAQELIIDHRIVVDLANWVYIWGHWPVIVATLLWLHHSHRFDYLVLRNAMFISGAIGLVIFATYPVAPPRLLDVGFADTVTENSSAYRVLQPPGLVNKYAAVPSLHAGWNVLIGIALLRTAHARTLKAFAVLSPVLMAIAVVVTANHYVVDVIVGALVSLVGLALAQRFTPHLIALDRRLLLRDRSSNSAP